MFFSRAKNPRIFHYIYSDKKSFSSIFISSVLLVTSLSTPAIALDENASQVSIPALCDPLLLPSPTQNPTPTPTPSTEPSPTDIPNPEVIPEPAISPSVDPSPSIEPSPTTSPTPEPISSPTPDPAPTPTTPEVEPEPLLSGDYVAPPVEAAEFSNVIKVEQTTTEIIPQIVCPSQVINVSALAQNTSVVLTWEKGNSGIENTIENINSFYVQVLETNQIIKVSADQTSAFISGLTNGTTYSFVVYAASEYGASIASEVITATPLSGNEGEVAGLIVEFKPEANVEAGQTEVPGQELITEVDLTIENKITEDVHLVEFDQATTLDEAKVIAEELTKDEDVVWAEPDQFVYISNQLVNDPNYVTDQWNLWDKYGIGIGEDNATMSIAFDKTAGNGINVAVIDTGITSHPDLDSQIIPGFDFVSNPEFLKATREQNGQEVAFDGDYVDESTFGSLGWDNNPQDPGDWRGVGPERNSSWHGTLIAGIIAAQNNNQEGIAGIAPGAKIQPIRALSWRGGLLSDIASSITWASGGEVTGVETNPTPSKVINMSFSVQAQCPTTLQNAINDAVARGSVLVAAAGNNNDDVKNYAPANCENVITVGASNKDGKRASYSNYGLGIDVSAPGGDSNNGPILSTSNTGLTNVSSFGYSSSQGTSIAAAHVSAIAARIFSKEINLTANEIKQKIINKDSVREFADNQCDINSDIYCGEGIVSLFQIAAACTPTQTTSGGFIIQSFTSTTSCEWTVPTGVTNIKVLAVGGGGGGGADGGSGGGGGELRSNTSQTIAAGTVITVAVGAGGWGGNWSGGYGAGSGNDTTLTWSSTVQYRAKGGTWGGGWTTTTGGAGGSGGVGGTGTNGQQGGGGPGSCNNSTVSRGTSPSGTTPSNSITGSTVYYGGGGGGGNAFNGQNAGSAVLGAAGGTSSGGRGANYKLALDGVTAINGASTGQNAVANTGGGGGGGSACDARGAYGVGFDGVSQRTAGGSGADGIVVISYIDPLSPPTVTSVTSSGNQITVNFSAPSVSQTITGYRVQYSTNGSSWTTASDSVSSSATSYTITGLSESTTYYTRVAAKYSSGISSYGYYWQKIYWVKNPTRSSSGYINYESGYGIGAGNASSTYASTSFTRVRYEMSATYGGENYFVKADFNRTLARSTSASSSYSINNLQIPTTNSSASLPSSYQFSIHGEVSDLTVESNVSTVESGNGLSGILEIWPWNYSTAATSPFTERSSPSSTYDDADSYTSSGVYGSFQLHRYSASDSSKNKTIFAWNRHYSGTTPEIGFGNHTGNTHSDWTFAADTGAAYTTRTNFDLGIFINPPTTTGLAAPTIASASISGTKVVGETLTASANTVTGTSTTTSYQWQSATTSGGTYSNIAGATNQNYVLTSNEATKFIKVVITVTNSGGSASATSSATTVILSSCSSTDSTPTVDGVQWNVKQFLSTPSTCYWVPPSNVNGINLLVIGGGGGAGSRGAGGGGAGGFVEANSYTVTPGSNYEVVVGTGGAGAASNTQNSGSVGNPSSFKLSGTGITALGGGAGLSHANNGNGGSAGSGSGTGGTVYSFSGGLGATSNTCGTSDWCGGGGGGAGSAGSNASSTGGNGGNGRASSITGVSTLYAGGGGGGGGSSGNPSSTPSAGGSGGTGGGGNGATSTYTTGCYVANGSNGTDGTGGGGGGGSYCDYSSSATGQGSGGSGGSGIVIVAYASAPTVTSISPTSGTITGSISLTITGTNFISGATATVGGVSLTSVSVVSGTTITGTIPANSLSMGTYDVVVTTSSGASTGGTGLYSGLGAALTPTFGTPTPTSDGFTVQISNYSASYTWAGTATASGTVSVSGTGLVTVSGVAPGTSSTATITTTRTGYTGGSATVSATSITGAALTPTFGTPTATSDGFTVTITNYDSNYTFATPTVSSGSVAVTSTSGSNRVLTVTGITAGTSATITQTTSRTGYSNGSATASGFAIPTIAGATISGTQEIGNTLTATPGTRSGTSLTTSYQWQYSDDNSTWTDISDATNSTYAISGTTYRGKYLRVAITVTNTGGTATAYSTATSQIYYPSCSTTDSTYTADGITYNVRQFLNTGTCDWTTPNNVSKAEVLVVGGGGGGGGSYDNGGSGGGGGGQVKTGSNISLLNIETVVVGTGGSGGATGTANGADGGSSSFKSVTSLGGLGGCHSRTTNNCGGTAATASAAAKGGNGGGTTNTGGGGGGSSSNGVSPSTAISANGGSGTTSLILGPTNSRTYGVGGTGRKGGAIRAATSVSNNSGNGGSGSGSQSSNTNAGGSGGSGVVVISYADAPTVSAISPTTGAISGNFSVTITGTNFTSDSTATIGGVSLTSVSVISGTTITGTIPANSLTAGTYDVVVTTTSGSSTGGTGLYEAVLKTNPTISGFSNTSALYSESTKALTAPTANVAGAFTYSSSDTSVASFASLSSSTATLNGVGSATITATFTPSNTSLYNTVTSTITLTVTQGNQNSLTITSTNGTYGTALTLTTNGGSGDGSVTYSVVRGDASSCSLSGTTLTAGSGGTCLVTATKAASTNYLAISSSQTTVTFAKANQAALTITSTNGTYGSGLTLTTSGGTTAGEIVYSVSNDTALGCSITSGVLSVTQAGRCLVTATMAGSGSYETVSSSQTTITFAKATPSLSSFGSILKTYGDSSFSLTAPTVGSSLPGTFSYASSDLTVATISTSTVSIVKAGTATITATFTPSDGTNYETRNITATLTIDPKSITITAETKSKYFGDTTPTNSFTNSTLVGSDAISSVTYTYSSTNSSTAPTAVGSYTITPSAAVFSTGNSNNYDITYSPGTYTISKATPTLSIINDISKTYGNSTFSLTAPTASSFGNSVAGTTTYTSSNTAVASVSGSTVTVVGAGTATFTATFSPTTTASYNSTTTTFTITVATLGLVITAEDKSKNFGGSTPSNSYSLSTPLIGSDAISSLTYTYSGTGTTTAPTAVGDYTITPSAVVFSSGLTSNYSISYASGDYTISKATQSTLSLTSTSGTFGSGLTLTTSGGSGSGNISYSVTDTTATGCSISEGVLTVTSAGTCSVTVTKAADSSYNAISSSATTVNFAKANQASLSITSITGTFGSSLTLTTSGGTTAGSIVYAVSNDTALGCSITSGVLTVTQAGTCLVTATMAGSGSYETVSSNQTTITFNKAAQSDLTVTSVSGTYGTSLNLTSSGGSGTGNVTYTASTGTASSCTVSGTTLTAGSSGTCFVTASKATDSNYLVKSSNPTTVSFAKATPSLSGFNDVSKTYGDSNFTVTAPSVTGSVAGSFTYTTSNSLVADVSSTTISILSAGTATITATFNPTATDSYNSQTTTMVVTVAQKEITITAEGKTKNYGSSTPTNTYSLSTALVGSDAISSLTYTYSGTNSTSAPTNAGSYSITPSAAIFSSGDINNYDISYSPGTYTISKITPSLSGFSDISKTYGDSTFTLTAPTSSVAGSFSYATSSSSVISLSGTTATVAGAGSSTITASFTPSDSTNYNSTSTTMVITVAKASQSAVSFTSTSSVNYGNTISLSATGGTGTGSISYAVASGTCTISSSTLTPGNAGSTCIITASRAADSNYLIETSEPQTITINKVTPTLSGFSNIAKTYGDNSFNLTSPTVSGSLAGVFGYVSSNLSAASVSGSTVTVNGYGSTTITATFTPSDLTNYYSTTTSLVITVAKKALRVTPDNKNKNFGASHPSNSRTDTGLVGSESISTITYLYEGTGSTTYSSSSTPPTNAGTYSITPQVSALSDGDLNNYEITYDSSTLTIAKINQSSLSISSASTATYGQDLTLSTTGGSGTGSVTFAKVSGDCTLNNSGATYSITPGDAGNTCVVSATKAADNNYNVISSSNQTITITKANQTLTFTSTPSSTLINSTYTPTITSTHSISGVTTGITPTFDIANSSNSICSLTGLVITFNRAGTCEIEAEAISSTNYEAATTTSQIITVTNPPASSSPRNNPTPTPSASPNATQRNNPIRDVVKRIVDAIQNLPNNIPNPNSVPPINSPELRPSFPSRSDSSLPNFSNPGLAITDSLGRLPKSEPGEKQIAIEGNFLPVQEYITPQGNLGITIPQSIDAPPVEFILQTTDVQGQSIPVSDDGIIRAVKGQTIKVAGDGLAPGTEFSAWLFSDPIKLGEGKVSRDSSFEKVFIIPDGMQTGNHTLQINGMSADKKVVSLTTGVIVSEVKQIQTVSDSKTDLIGYGILIIFFLVLVIALLLRYIRKLKANHLV